MIIETRKILQHIRIPVTGVVHVGAHEAQELEFYRSRFGNVPVFWIEADPITMRPLKRALSKDANSYPLNEAVADTLGTRMEFHRANMDQSSSLLELGTHQDVHPEVSYVDSFSVVTTTLDTLSEKYDFSECNFLNMDVQGAEGLVLKGAREYLKNVNYIYTEVNRDELYVGCMQLPEMDKLLDINEFDRVETEIYDHLGWGDALYVRRKT